MTNGKEIVFDEARDYGGSRLMRIRAQTGAQAQPLTPPEESADSPAISPRGNRLAYTKITSDTDVWQIRSGSTPRRFAPSTRYEDSPQYSPDGERVAFVSYRSGHSQIWVCDKDGANPAQLTHDDAQAVGTPRWSPDGRWIAFDSNLKEAKRILVMASDGGQVRELTPGAEDVSESAPSWSWDGKWIYYSCTRSGRFEIWRVPAEGGKAVQITHSGGWVGFESFDGQTLYYVKDDSSALWALPIRGGEERQVLASVYHRAFAVVEDGIYYIPKPNERAMRLSVSADWKEMKIAR
jgi:Tol biopolymer transport system component